MSFRQRPGFSSRKPLPTISETPSGASSSLGGAQASTSPRSSSLLSSSLSSRSKSSKSAPNTSKSLRQTSLGIAGLGPLNTPLVKPRSSKTSQKHVTLPTDAQDAPLPPVLETPDINIEAAETDSTQEAERDNDEEDSVETSPSNTRKARRMRSKRDETFTKEVDAIWKRTLGEQLSPDQRDQMGYQRLTAYYCCEEFKMGLLSGFLKKEHNVSPR